jgi:integrase/recombinase XerD
VSKPQRFLSALAIPIEKYIAEKQAVGYKFIKHIQRLKSFDRFVKEQYATETALTKHMVMAWTARKPNETIANQNHKISLVRGLAEYMNRAGFQAYVYPKGLFSVQRYSYMPYIFSMDEIKRIFDVCDHYPPSSITPNRHLILPLLMRMLYGCGLRLSEVTRLKLADVDLRKGTLFIRDTKFNKERILPMADSLTGRCHHYCSIANIGKMNNPYLFPSPYGGHYSEERIYQLFRDVLRRAGIAHLGRGRGPRIHDIRHLFSINCLKKWVLEGKDLHNCLPYLSAYLGHEDLRGTQHYLRLTADIYPDILTRIEKTCAHLIPEVDWHEAD